MTTTSLRARSAGALATAAAVLAVTASGAAANPTAYITQGETGNGPPTNRISLFDAATGAETGSITVGQDPGGVVFTPDGTRAYVGDDDGVEVVDTATNAVLKTISLDHVSNLAIRPDGARVYVTRASDNDVKVISTATDAVVDTIGVGDTPRPIVVNAAGTRAYVGNVGSPDSITILDLTTDTSLGNAAGGAALDRPENLAITPDGSTVYAANFGASSGGKTVAVLATATKAITGTIPVGTSPTGLTVDPAGKRLYVSDRDSLELSVVDTATNAVTGDTPLGFSPSAVAVTPQGDRLVVASRDMGKVAVVDIASNSIAGSPAAIEHGGSVSMPPVQTPVAGSLAATPAAAGSPTAFTTSGASAKFGAVGRYDYDFGDGSSASDAGPATAHTYAAAGSYSVAVKVSNDCAPGAVFGPLGAAFAGMTPYCAGSTTATANTQVTIAPGPAPAVDPAQSPGTDPTPGSTPDAIPPAGKTPRPGLDLTNVSADRYCIGTGKGAGKDITVSYTLNDPARVSFTIQRRTKPFAAPRKACPVRKPGGPGAVPVTFGKLGDASLDSGKGENYATVDARSTARAAAVTAKKGSARLRLATILSGRKLTPGWYRLLLQGTRLDDGSRSQVVDVKFWVLVPPAKRR